MQAGFAEADITPPVGTLMSGYFHSRWVEEIHDPLYARAMALSDGEDKVIFVACDVLSLKNRTVAKIRKAIRERYGVPEGNIMVSATHTHTGPQTADIFVFKADMAYVEQLEAHIVGAAGMALDRLAEARVRIACGSAPGLSFNRRFHMKDGSVKMHPSKTDPDKVKPEGPDYDEVGIFCVEDGEGLMQGCAVNFACHPTAFGGGAVISADYPGAVAETIKRLGGGHVVPLFLNGACGNLCQIDVYNTEATERGPDHVRKMGLVLGCEAVKAAMMQDPASAARVRAERTVLSIPIREVTDEMLADARRRLSGYDLPLTEEQIKDLDRVEYIKAVYAQELLWLAEERQLKPNEDVEVHVIAVGDAAFVGVPCEFFVEHALSIKERSPFKFTFVVEQANGCVGYVPTKHAFDSQDVETEGPFSGSGYETTLARSSKLIPEAGDMMVDEAVRLLKRLKAREG